MSVGFEVTRKVDHSRRLTHRVVVRGELDLATAGVLRRHLTQSCEEGAMLVFIDAADVTFIDSAGLNCLISAWKEFKVHGGRLVVDRTSSAVDRVFELTGLVDPFRNGHDADGNDHDGATTSAMDSGSPNRGRQPLAER